METASTDTIPAARFGKDEVFPSSAAVATQVRSVNTAGR